MKKCTYCGRENPDESTQCGLCHTDLVAPAHPEQSREPVTSAAEQHFWDRMTFREFGVLLVRLQALWVLFPAVVELTYLPGYLSTFFPAHRFDVLPPEMKHTFYLALLRIALRVTVGIGVFIYADRLLSWLARGVMLKTSPNKTLQPTATNPSASTE